MYEQTTSPEFLLLKRVIDGHGRARHDVLIVYIGHHAYDASWSRADVNEFHHRVSPHDMAVECFLSRKHSLRHALTHDNDRLSTSTVGVVEIASGDQPNTKRSEKPRRNRPEAGA